MAPSCSVLVIEDQFFVAMSVADAIEESGGRPLGPAASVADALRILDHERVDLALVDINLEGELSYPAIDALRERGVNVILMTGYDSPSIDSGYRSLPRLRKPVSRPILIERVRQACGAA